MNYDFDLRKISLFVPNNCIRKQCIVITYNWYVTDKDIIIIRTGFFVLIVSAQASS